MYNAGNNIIDNNAYKKIPSKKIKKYRYLIFLAKAVYSKINEHYCASYHHM